MDGDVMGSFMERDGPSSRVFQHVQFIYGNLTQEQIDSLDLLLDEACPADVRISLVCPVGVCYARIGSRMGNPGDDSITLAYLEDLSGSQTTCSQTGALGQSTTVDSTQPLEDVVSAIECRVHSGICNACTFGAAFSSSREYNSQEQQSTQFGGRQPDCVFVVFFDIFCTWFGEITDVVYPVWECTPASKLSLRTLDVSS